jgi:hypothetical protein
MLPTKFPFIWPNDFRGEDFKKMIQSETRMACGGPSSLAKGYDSGPPSLHPWRI